MMVDEMKRQDLLPIEVRYICRKSKGKTLAVLHCTILYCTALHYTILHCTALLYRTVQLYRTVLHCTALHCTVLY